MRTFLLGLVAIAAAYSSAGAQQSRPRQLPDSADAAMIRSAASHRMMQASDSLMLNKRLYHNLMAGIVLTAEQRARAEGVIAAEERAYWATPNVPSATFDCKAWERLAHRVAQRDSTLLAMMTTAADSAKFSQNAANYVEPPCSAIVGHP